MTSNSSSPVVTGWPGRVRCAFSGLGLVFRSQDSARIQLLAAIAVVLLGLALRLSAAEWCAVVLAVAVVLATEAVNTAIELVVDLASPGYNVVAGRAKDVAAGAVLIAAFGAAAVGAIVFGPHVWARLHG
jgi:diacylglycerol kinase (ATP)